MIDTRVHSCQYCGRLYTNAAAALMCGCMTLSTTREPVEPEPVPEPKAAELLGRAAKHMHDRAATYDKPEGERSMGRAVAAFNAITGHTLSESEGWLLLQVLKDVRLFTRSEYHADSAEDCIAYAALKAEARGEGR